MTIMIHGAPDLSRFFLKLLVKQFILYSSTGKLSCLTSRTIGKNITSLTLTSTTQLNQLLTELSHCYINLKKDT